jgi:hypothetical protein
MLMTLLDANILNADFVQVIELYSHFHLLNHDVFEVIVSSILNHIVFG